MPDYVKTVGLFYLLVFSDINKSKNLLTSLLGICIRIDNKTWQRDALMDKEKILELSRKENKNQDIYEKEVLVAGNKYSCIVAAILALILCISLDKKFENLFYFD